MIFDTERSDFGCTVAGYILLAAVCVCNIIENLQGLTGWFETGGMNYQMIYPIVGIMLLITGGIALWKAYLLDGILFLFFGIFTLVPDSDALYFLLIFGMAVLALMAFRVRDYFVGAIAVLMFLLSVLSILSYHIDFGNGEYIFVAFGVAIGAIAAYIGISDWALVQDISLDYEEEMFGDDECCCHDDGCECEECQCEEKKE